MKRFFALLALCAALVVPVAAQAQAIEPLEPAQNADPGAQEDFASAWFVELRGTPVADGGSLTDLNAEKKLSDEFGAYADNMRKDISKAESRIKSLRQQVDMAKARDSVQKAQVSASIASGGANGKLETAVGTLNRLQAKQQQRAAELSAADELADASTGNDLERKLRDAGITPNEGSANAILERLKQKSAQ